MMMCYKLPTCMVHINPMLHEDNGAIQETEHCLIE